jgi:hypothetical protein
MKTPSSKEQILSRTGKLCPYCEKEPIKWFCSECWFGVCDDCLEEDRCQGECWRNVPLVIDIDVISEHMDNIDLA